LAGEGVPLGVAAGGGGALWAAAGEGGGEPAALPLERRLALSPLFTDQRLAALSVESAIARRTHAPGAGSTEHQLAVAEARLGLGPGDDADLPAPEDVTERARPASATTAGAAARHRAAEPGRVLGDGLVLPLPAGPDV